MAIGGRGMHGGSVWHRLGGLLLAFMCVVGQVRAEVAAQPALKMPLATHVVFLGLASAGDRVVAVGERGVVIRSDDRGATWIQADVPVRATLTAVTFVDGQTGFAVGHDAVILKTTDGGTSWSLVNFDPASQVVLLNVRFRDARNGYVVGSNGQLWSTQDGGTSWQRRTLAVEDWYQNHIFDIAWLASGPTLAVAEKGVLYRSEDGLSGFASVESPYEGSYFGALTLPNAAFLIYGMNGHVFESRDGGISWNKIQTNTEQFLLDAAILPDGRALIVGAGGTLVVVDASSETAQVVTRPGGAGINAILIADQDAYLADLGGGVKKLPLVELLPR